MASIPRRTVNLGRQAAAIHAVLPHAQTRVHKGRLWCRVPLQPAPICQIYTVQATYRHRTRPRVIVVDPELELHPRATALPHVYPDGDLCLHLPGEWNDSMYLATTILPWTSEWLLHYELWLITGRWSGSGHDHAVANDSALIDPVE
ncbi:hypothetical protein [Nonomuraea rubra]|uniref:hypothetical protein n=1 Tax=Nonomuraea rubra TaxID=46180 RepID=UPI0033CCE35F